MAFGLKLLQRLTKQRLQDVRLDDVPDPLVLNLLGQWKTPLSMYLKFPRFYYLLVFVPLSAMTEWLGSPPWLVFLLSGLAIVPLAAIIADATEKIAGQVGQSLGGLLNATFGNATEMIVSVVALKEGLVEVVKASISGTIIANLLLALGAGLFFGGLKYREQRFQSRTARINASSLSLALVVILSPTAIDMTSDGLAAATIDRFSLVASFLLFSFYLLSLLFTMHTHRHLYERGDDDEGDVLIEQGRLADPLLALLACSVVLVGVSEVLVNSLKGTIHSLGLSELFTGVILIPLFGGAVEFITVIRFARKNKMDLAVTVAMGSSLQIAMFVAPILVFVGYAMGQPMNLQFHPFELLAIGVAVVLANSISADGQSNWLEGAMLMVCYGVVTAAFYFHP